MKPATEQTETENINKLAAGIIDGDRRLLARAISLIESTRTNHRLLANALLNKVLSKRCHTLRLGISGVPGVGKSTFIEALGLHLVEAGHRVAVLAIDPSSPRSGGAILGDKTRMEELSRHPNAFIRPSPSKGTLGGVARRTREVMLCIEAAGFDVLLIETVGVGQSETAVAGLTDMFILLIAPGGGDDLQGIKRGIVELADLIVVNKADGDLAATAERTQRDYMAALHLMHPSKNAWATKVVKCSAMERTGIVEIWSAVEKFKRAAKVEGFLDQNRCDQAIDWMWNEITEALVIELKSDPNVLAELEAIEASVRGDAITPSLAAQKILKLFSK